MHLSVGSTVVVVVVVVVVGECPRQELPVVVWWWWQYCSRRAHVLHAALILFGTIWYEGAPKTDHSFIH